MKPRRAAHSTVVLLIAMLSACSSRVEYLPAANNASTGTLNINTATVAELEKLPGVGPKTADSIIRFRDEHGPFRRPEHLLRIPGISEARFAEIRALIKTE